MSTDVGVVIYMIYNGWTTLGYIAIFFTVGVFVVLSGVRRALALWRFRVIARQIERYKRLDGHTTPKKRNPAKPPRA